MKTRAPLHAFLVLLVAALTAPSAHAIDWIRTRDLQSFCEAFLVKADSPSGRVCISYIQGFLDGLKSTEDDRFQRIAAGEPAGEDSDYTFTLAGVCLPRDTGINRILRVAARAIVAGSTEAHDPEHSVITALRENYGCEQDSS
ncbi:MAG TPA: Rap1a/Tai family immunity protein [Gammaproteobacteria bacterium]|nr:Rap1a/Tai family immunity protein [Gammaproteobacteria bacterium]